MEIESEWAAHGGRQLVCRHASRATGGDMTFAVYLPPAAAERPCPVLWYLSGLTCTHANVMEKGEYRRDAAEKGLIVVCPDTSPRGDAPDDEAYDLGQGAGFYLDASQDPWAGRFNMETYITRELPDLVAAEFPANMGRQGIFGHSMGGHGALTLALRHQGRFASVSAFAPIVAPAQVPWGEKAFTAYLGADDRAAWRRHDAVALIEEGARVPEILVDQGEADTFLERELRPELLVKACADAGIPLEMRRQPGYDHSYYFISTFMPSHVQWHASRLG